MRLGLFTLFMSVRVSVIGETKFGTYCVVNLSFSTTYLAHGYLKIEPAGLQLQDNNESSQKEWISLIRTNPSVNVHRTKRMKKGGS